MKPGCANNPVFLTSNNPVNGCLQTTKNPPSGGPFLRLGDQEVYATDTPYLLAGLFLAAGA